MDSAFTTDEHAIGRCATLPKQINAGWRLGPKRLALIRKGQGTSFQSHRDLVFTLIE